MSEELVFLTHALWMGAIITFVYDLLIIWRQVVSHKIFWESLEDLGFWMFCAIFVFSWLYRESNGVLRWYAVAGALLGMFCYKKTISRFFVRITVRIVKTILTFLWKILFGAMTPFRFLRRKMVRAHANLKLRRRKMQSKMKYRLKSFINTLKIRLCKQ